MGIDPGLQNIGWGIIESTLNTTLHKDSGVIKTNSNLQLGQRLSHIFLSIKLLLNQYRPDVCIVEQTFVGANYSTGIKLGSAYGVIITAVDLCHCKMISVPTKQIKQKILNNGSGTKLEIQDFINTHFNLSIKSLDISDALATAYYIHLCNNESTVSTSNL